MGMGMEMEMGGGWVVVGRPGRRRCANFIMCRNHSLVRRTVCGSSRAMIALLVLFFRVSLSTDHRPDARDPATMDATSSPQ